MNNRIFYTPKEKKQFHRKHRGFRWYMAMGIILVLMFGTGLFFVVRISALQVADITMSGLDTLREDNVRQEVALALNGSYALGFIPYRFIIAVPIEAITRHLQNRFPLIGEVEIQKEFPDKLFLAIRERELFGVLCNDATLQEDLDMPKDTACAYIDTDGIAYQQAPQSHGFLITKISTDDESIPYTGQAIKKETIDRMIDLSKILPPIIGSPILGYELLRTSSREMRVFTRQGFSLLMKRDGDKDALMFILKTVLEKEIGQRRAQLDYMDLRFGNKVFYKFK